MTTASFQVATYQYYDWSSRKSGKTNLILKGTGGETCSVWFVEDPSADLPQAPDSCPELLRFLLPSQSIRPPYRHVEE
jgi:hypothetical protein